MIPPPRSAPDLAAVFFLVLFADSRAETWHVYPDGSGSAATINAAVDSAAYGDTVLVWPGDYYESVDVRSGVSVVGQAGAEQTVIHALGTARCLDGSELQDVLIEGLKLTGVHHAGYGSYAYAALSLTGDLEVRDCVVEDHSATYGGMMAGGDVVVSGTRFERIEGGTDVPVTAGIHFGEGGSGRTLTVEDCEFIDLDFGDIVHLASGQLVFRNNRLRTSHGFGLTIGDPWYEWPAHAVIENNLFDQSGDQLLDAIVVETSDAISVEICNNSFVRAGQYRAALGPWVGKNAIIERNTFTGADWGLWVCDECTGAVIRCNDAWGNRLDNWYNLPDLTGVDGNFSEAPRYCDPEGGEFTLSASSPLLPWNNDCSELIGAFSQGCAAVSLEPTSWGLIKARYRR